MKDLIIAILARSSWVCNLCIWPLGYSEICVVQTRVPFFSLLGSGRGDVIIHNKNFTTLLEGVGQLVYLIGCTKKCHFCPQISWFFGSLMYGWPGLVHNWYLLLCHFSLLGPPHHHKASNHYIFSKLMCYFYLQHPPSSKQFDPWDVKHLLSMLGSCALMPLLLLILNLLGRQLCF